MPNECVASDYCLPTTGRAYASPFNSAVNEPRVDIVTCGENESKLFLCANCIRLLPEARDTGSMPLLDSGRVANPAPGPLSTLEAPPVAVGLRRYVL